MQLKTWIASLGLGAAAGAAAILLMPKHSQTYRVANEAAQTIKIEAGKMLDAIRNG